MSAGQDKSAKDKMMAARMKAQGIERTTMQCPMCHRTVTQKQFDSHLNKCAGRGR